MPATPGDHTPYQECIAPVPQGASRRGGGRGSPKHDVDRVGYSPVCGNREGDGLCPDCLAPTHLPGDARRAAANRCTVDGGDNTTSPHARKGCTVARELEE
jgi:hypothetical protein